MSSARRTAHGARARARSVSPSRLFLFLSSSSLAGSWCLLEQPLRATHRCRRPQPVRQRVGALTDHHDESVMNLTHADMAAWRHGRHCAPMLSPRALGLAVPSRSPSRTFALARDLLPPAPAARVTSGRRRKLLLRGGHLQDRLHTELCVGPAADTARRDQ
eukprot:scaffold16232_cov126-Isochrysis_galbana.AAC.5